MTAHRARNSTFSILPKKTSQPIMVSAAQCSTHSKTSTVKMHAIHTGTASARPYVAVVNALMDGAGADLMCVVAVGGHAVVQHTQAQ